jgi:hypothetical protein
MMIESNRMLVPTVMNKMMAVKYASSFERKCPMIGTKSEDRIGKKIATNGTH